MSKTYLGTDTLIACGKSDVITLPKYIADLTIELAIITWFGNVDQSHFIINVKLNMKAVKILK